MKFLYLSATKTHYCEYQTIPQGEPQFSVRVYKTQVFKNSGFISNDVTTIDLTIFSHES